MRYILLQTLFLLIASTMFSQAIPVEVKQIDGKWTMFRDGEPYFVKGVGALPNWTRP